MVSRPADAQGDRERSDAPDAFRIPHDDSPLPAPAGARLGAVSLITRAASKRKLVRGRVIDYLLGSRCCPASGTPVAPRCPTRDLVLLYSSSRFPVPIE